MAAGVRGACGWIRSPLRAAWRKGVASDTESISELPATVDPYAGTHHADHERRHDADVRAEPPANRPADGGAEPSQDLGHHAPLGFSWSSIQDVPNRSRNIAKRCAKKFCSI